MTFVDTNGTASNLSLFNVTGTNYPFQVKGESNMTVTNLLVDGCNKAVLFFGGNTTAEASSASITNFLFRNVYRIPSPSVGGNGVLSVFR